MVQPSTAYVHDAEDSVREGGPFERLVPVIELVEVDLPRPVQVDVAELLVELLHDLVGQPKLLERCGGLKAGVEGGGGVSERVRGISLEDGKRERNDGMGGGRRG